MGVVTRHVRVTGHVQGVFYRVWAQGQARELGVSGWIRNDADNSVEARLTGDEDCVSRMIERMQRGPANARVDGVEVEEVEPGEDSHRFEVRH